ITLTVAGRGAPGPGWVPVEQNGATWFAERGCDIWHDAEADAAFASVSGAFAERNEAWIDAASVVELAVAAPDQPVAVPFGRRVVEVWSAGSDAGTAVLGVRHLRVEELVLGEQAA